MKLQNMKLIENFRFCKKYLGKIADVSYMFLFTVLLTFDFLEDTTFQIPWQEWMQEEVGYCIINTLLFHPEMILFIVLVCRYLFSCTYNIKMYLITFVACLCAYYAYRVGGKDLESIFIFFLLVFGARGFSFRKLMQWYTIVVEILFAVTVAVSQTGYMENLIYEVQNRNTRISFGFIYPTVFAAHLFFLFLCLWYLAQERWNLILAVLSLLASGFVYLGCEARFASICFGILAVILMLSKWKIWPMHRWNPANKMSHYFVSMLTLIPVLCSLVIHILCIRFRIDIGWMAQLNQLLSNRLRLAKKGIDVYGFHLWGSRIPMVGYGGTTEIRERYFYLDSIYIQLSLVAGLVVLGMVLVMLFSACYKAKVLQEWVLLWILVFVGLHGVIEEHLLSIAVCPFLFAVSTEIRQKRRAIYENDKVER